MYSDYQKKIELIIKLFLDYGKNVNADNSVVKNYVQNLSHIDCDELENLIVQIRQSDKFPRWVDIDNLYNSKRILNKDESVECNQCNRSGMIYGIKCGSTVIRSVNFPNEYKNKYYTTVIGRCRCENGNQYVNFPQVEVPRFIKDYANEHDEYVNVSASELCKQLNKGEYANI